MQILVKFFLQNFLFFKFALHYTGANVKLLRVIKCNASFFYRLIFLTINCRNCKMEIGYHEFWIIQKYNCFFVNSYFALATVFVRTEDVEKCSCNLIFFIWKRFHFRTDFGQAIFCVMDMKINQAFFTFLERKTRT